MLHSQRHIKKREVAFLGSMVSDLILTQAMNSPGDLLGAGRSHPKTHIYPVLLIPGGPASLPLLMDQVEKFPTLLNSVLWSKLLHLFKPILPNL